MNKTALRMAFAAEIDKMAAENNAIVVLTSDATGSAGLESYAKDFPDRLIEMGIAEQNEVSVAAGLSTCGYTPFVCAPAAFMSSRALEQVKIDLAYSDTNVKIIGISGGLSYGTSGYTHHAVTDLAATVPLENLTVLLPSDAIQMAKLARIAAATKGPFYIRIGRNPVPDIYESDESFEIGKAKRLRTGSDLTICAAGEVVCRALEAAELLAKKGVSAGVLDLFSIKPLDRQAINAAADETGRILVAEEHLIYGGLGSLVCQTLASRRDVTVKCLGIPDGHILSGENGDMFKYYGLDAEGIAASAEAMLKQ